MVADKVKNGFYKNYLFGLIISLLLGLWGYTWVLTNSLDDRLAAVERKCDVHATLLVVVREDVKEMNVELKEIRRLLEEK